MSGGRYVRPADTFPSFESRYEATGFSPRALAQELNESVHLYAVISSHQPDENAQVTRALAGLKHA